MSEPMTDAEVIDFNLPCGHRMKEMRHIVEQWRDLKSSFKCQECGDICCLLTPEGERQTCPIEHCVVLGTGINRSVVKGAM
jgi:hypothetical protein